MHRLHALLAALLFAPMAMAQTVPDQRGPHVNDYADMLSDAAEARIGAFLTGRAARFTLPLALQRTPFQRAV